MSVLVLAQLTAGTGNRSTASRICDYLRAAGYQCFLHCPTSLPDKENVIKLIEEKEVKCVIGIHAYRVANQLIASPCPFCVVFGGTDLNECDKVKSKMEVMSTVTSLCKYAIAFNKPMKMKACQLWPDIEEKLLLIPQGVNVSPSNFSISRYLANDGGHLGINTYNNNMIIFLLVSGLRKVKDPLFVAKVVSDWHQEDRRIHLFIVGPKLDEDFAKECEKEVARLPGVIVFSVFNRCDLHAIMRDSTAIVNSSKSEGMPSAIIEGMALGTPVIARSNEGCVDLIDQRNTGLLYSTPQEFRTVAEELLHSTLLRERLISKGRNYVDTRHSMAKERQAYSDLVTQVIVGKS